MASGKLSAAYLKYSVVVTEMKFLPAVMVLFTALLFAGCSVTSNTKSRSELINQIGAAAVVTNDQKAQAVAAAGIGVPQVYTDPKLGRSVELLVQSEYFSANGRNCRRYTQTVKGRSVAGVSCQDQARGWVDIPLSSFVR